ncbi:carbohydrate ABC transporter membrane protein 2, CUT1 family [Quadrisphaera granulorum]|uniref:Carbohydrate ABC transporter membrane protein 2 (CUT1 family) n=1 Tax=Quadrisphaera granulorum TaxID=317664 RepID=A0A315ZSP9_9ACTN|nr:carbohydrate ABC transporter permease [Quadrisphaera granulorum]PWJ48312.1 carbohydrate ABC transporter membrane protein 2 (CUT1 family) [Quadrisphaera granulorum]SZE98473.1 carbohydrate ABC transporter membrane protein 2, CUT1 family [Quadrisphaera granulorum]
MSARLRSRRLGGLSPLAAAATYLVLLAGALLALAPFALSVLTSLKQPVQLARQATLTWPDPLTFDNYTELLSGASSLVPALVVTVQVALVLLVGQLTFSVLAAYAFARYDVPGGRLLFGAYLATMMVPQVVTVVPLYVMFSQTGLRNTFWGIVLPTLFGSPFAVYLLREHFRAVPVELEDAARLDGCGSLRVLRHVVLPLSRPVLATLAVITVVSQWNSFLWPLIITTGPTWQTLTVATAALQSQYNGNWTLVTAATTLAIAPLVVLFLLVQRHVTDSLTATGFR